MLKTKEEILKMTKEEIKKYQWSDDLGNLNRKCSGCSDCSGCFCCSDCSYCRNIRNLKYAICNVEMTKEEYFLKVKSLK